MKTREETLRSTKEFGRDPLSSTCELHAVCGGMRNRIHGPGVGGERRKSQGAAPSKPQGRGQALLGSPSKKMAERGRSRGRTSPLTSCSSLGGSGFIQGSPESREELGSSFRGLEARG